jgi:predicted DNA-binding transcriptional regulator AlpA
MSLNPLLTAIPVISPLALRPRDAAAALGISERLLQDWAKHSGLPCVRLGQVVLYPVDEIRQWLRERASTDSSPPQRPPPSP